jgi:UDP-N-acetylglucosamine acyltransferase
VIGDRNFLMSQAHVAHNCRVGNDVILATGATLGGHVTVEDQAFVSETASCTSIVASGGSRSCVACRAALDVPPFSLCDRRTRSAASTASLRRAVRPRRVRALATAFRLLFRTRTNLGAAIARLGPEARTPDVSTSWRSSGARNAASRRAARRVRRRRRDDP